jgi:hypothetical protein
LCTGLYQPGCSTVAVRLTPISDSLCEAVRKGAEWRLYRMFGWLPGLTRRLGKN